MSSLIIIVFLSFLISSIMCKEIVCDYEEFLKKFEKDYDEI